MSERDELVEVIRGVDGPATLGGEELAEAILSAGYRGHPKIERDDLRGTLSNTICNASNYPDRAMPYLLGGDMSKVLDRTVDAILAAGYRKSRTITTAGELRELPALAVVLFDDTENGGPFQTYVVPDDGTVMFARRTGEFHFNDFGENYIDAMNMPLPVAVLWEPR